VSASRLHEVSEVTPLEEISEKALRLFASVKRLLGNQIPGKVSDEHPGLRAHSHLLWVSVDVARWAQVLQDLRFWQASGRRRFQNVFSVTL
jgi:hypothetical protein